MSSPLPVLHTRHSVALAARRMLAPTAACAFLGPAAAGSAQSPDSVWLFVDTLQMVVEGTQSCAAVLRVDGAWARPNEHNTARFPRLSLEIYADFTRSPSLMLDAEARALRAFEPFREALHRPTGFAEIWGQTSSDPGLRVFGSVLLEEPDVYDMTDLPSSEDSARGPKRLRALFGLSVG